MPFGIALDLKRIVGKTKTRSQMGLIGTEDGRLAIREVPVLKGCAADNTVCSAWLLDSANQMQDESTGVWYQLWGERSTIPICPVRETKVKDLEKLMQSIFRESWVTDLITIAREAAQDKTRSWTYLIVGIPICLGALVLGIAVLGRGGA